MSLASDVDKDGRAEPLELDTRAPAPPADSPLAEQPAAPPEELPAPRPAPRRVRKRTRLKQAVAARGRRGAHLLASWSRLVTGIGVLVVVGIVTVVAGRVLGEVSTPNPTPEAIATVQPTLEVVERASVPPTPHVEPTPLSGPQVSAAMIEANAPLAGCVLHPSLAELRERIGPEMVGECIEDPVMLFGTEKRQRTNHGELIWSEDDQRASFTDGTRTWIAGPTGLVRRQNEERFEWERDADAGPRPKTTAHAYPTARPGAMLPSRRIVSYYGNPLSGSMGVLGEMAPESMFPRLTQESTRYATADGQRGVTPALELVAVVAQGQPGPDGLYRLRMETELIEKVAGWAEQRGFLLILDVQTGRGNAEDEIRWLMPFLKRPNIHLALDPEFAMPAGQVPGQRIGTMDASTINGAQRVLAELVDMEGLPPKLLVVHRFTDEMVTNAGRIATDPRVQVVMVMDGFGSPSVKARQYDELIAQERVQFTGMKLFYRHDEPLMTPDQVLLLDPPPDLIIYQ